MSLLPAGSPASLQLVRRWGESGYLTRTEPLRWTLEFYWSERVSECVFLEGGVKRNRESVCVSVCGWGGGGEVSCRGSRRLVLFPSWRELSFFTQEEWVCIYSAVWTNHVVWGHVYPSRRELEKGYWRCTALVSSLLRDWGVWEVLRALTLAKISLPDVTGLWTLPEKVAHIVLWGINVDMWLGGRLNGGVGVGKTNCYFI